MVGIATAAVVGLGGLGAIAGPAHADTGTSGTASATVAVLVASSMTAMSGAFSAKKARTDSRLMIFYEARRMAAGRRAGEASPLEPRLRREPP